MNLNDILILLTALVIAWSCSLLGCFLVLKKMVMVGDAISHSVLPGIVIAFLVTSQFDSVFLLIGAAVFGVLTTLLINFLHKKLKLQEDASIGISFSWLFSLGVLLIAFYTHGDTDIDQECILFGEIGTTFLDKVIWMGKCWGTRSFWYIFPVFCLVLVYVIIGYKGLQLISFDSNFAKSRGIKSERWDLVLMLLVSVTSVMSFESVGAILVVGLFVLPPATAYLLSKRLPQMLLLSCLIATISVVSGYFLACYFDVTIGSMMIVVAGLIFLLVLLAVLLKTRRNSSFQDFSILQKGENK
jgi:manganese/zinc/iron transport system permease protein